jgi:hypothetical protein
MVDVREYQSSDLDECRRLYGQLVEHHRNIYHDQTIGGADPGTGFESTWPFPSAS